MSCSKLQPEMTAAEMKMEPWKKKAEGIYPNTSMKN